MLTIEQIIALLQTKFAGVRKDGLAQLAKFIKLNATNQEEAQALVDGYTPELVTEFVNDYRKEVDKEVNNGVKTAESNFKKKYNVKDEPGTPPADPPTDPKPTDNPQDLAALITAGINAAMKPITEKISAFEAGNITKTRSEQLTGKLADSPKDFSDRVLRDYGRMNFETEEAFTEYLGEIETDLTAYNQSLSNQNLSSFGRPVVGGGKDGAVSSAVEQYVKETQGGKDAETLGGKEL